ncbi:MAG: DUF2490 domain-containing protein [Acidobacteria bacterium]|nr:DUF2490 domain-containing protein [Acidobacteriota bacterium]
MTFRKTLIVLAWIATGLVRETLVAQGLPEQQQWSEIQISRRLSDRIRWKILEVSPRFGDDISRFITLKLGTNVNWRAGRHFSLAPFFQYYLRRPTPDRTIREFRGGGDATFILTMANWTFQNRHRVDLRNLDHKPSWRFREQYYLSHPSPWKDLDLYTSYEFFYDSRVSRWRQTRMYVGASRDWKKWSLDAYYMLTDSHISKDEDFNVIGYTFSYQF